jgi:hypothetical protein
LNAVSSTSRYGGSVDGSNLGASPSFCDSLNYTTHVTRHGDTGDHSGHRDHVLTR